MKQNYKKILSEELIRISNLLKEEYSISDKVKYEATRITKEIKNGIVKGKKYEMILSENPYITFRHGTINSNAYGKPLTIHFQCYNFTDNNVFDEFRNKVPYRIKNQYNRKANILDVSIDAVGGYIRPTTLYDTIQHELEHAFQEDKIGMSFGDKPLYAIAKEFRKSDKTVAENNIGEILYLTHRAEQDGFVNGLYAFLKHNYETTKMPTSYIFEMSDMYGVLERMIELQTYIRKNRNNKELIDAISKLKQSSHIGYSRLISIIDDAINRLRKKIVKVIFKAQKDTNYYNDMEFSTYNENHYVSIRKIINGEIDKIINKI